MFVITVFIFPYSSWYLIVRTCAWIFSMSYIPLALIIFILIWSFQGAKIISCSYYICCTSLFNALVRFEIVIQIAKQKYRWLNAKGQWIFHSCLKRILQSMMSSYLCLFYKWLPWIFLYIFQSIYTHLVYSIFLFAYKYLYTFSIYFSRKGLEDWLRLTIRDLWYIQTEQCLIVIVWSVTVCTSTFCQATPPWLLSIKISVIFIDFLC